jgi:hypothetical protein
MWRIIERQVTILLKQLVMICVSFSEGFILVRVQIPLIISKKNTGWAK